MFSWRDGESFLLIPEGINREELWLREESGNIDRNTLVSLEISYLDNVQKFKLSRDSGVRLDDKI